jgi:hypothetical protein
MVKVYGPALSIDASGTLAKTMVFSKWKGRSYVRSHVNPAQPRTGPQVGVRAMFSFLAKQWASLTSANKTSWEVLAKQFNVSPFNASTHVNQARWRNFLTPSKNSAVAGVSVAPTICTQVLTVGVRQITVTITKGGTAPTWGYSIHRYLVTGATPAFSNCVHISPIDGSSNATWVDTPLDPGTYFYKVHPFNDDGVKGVTSVESTATVV